MIHKQFNLIETTDIQALVDNKVSESKVLDYKEDIPRNSDRDKKEFLADISCLANASGGYLIYGVTEERDSDGKPTGVPKIVNGLPSINCDTQILRFENIIRDGIEPRINGIQIKVISGFYSGPVILIRVPKSWLAPHMVTFRGTSRFYSRDNRGRYQMDISQIRSAFALSAELPEKTRHFRDERLSKIVSGETPVHLEGYPKSVLHILPVASFDMSVSIDLTWLESNTERLTTIWESGHGHRYNFDGFLTFFPNSLNALTYLQIFRNGFIEAVDSRMLKPTNGRKLIPSITYEKRITEALGNYLRILRDCNFEPPIFVILTLLGVKDYLMGVNAFVSPIEIYPIEREMLLLPDKIVNNFDENPYTILKDAFDSLWQSAGWPRSMNYDQDGNWNPPHSLTIL